jgi:hypothetical protein
MNPNQTQNQKIALTFYNSITKTNEQNLKLISALQKQKQIQQEKNQTAQNQNNEKTQSREELIRNYPSLFGWDKVYAALSLPQLLDKSSEKST